MIVTRILMNRERNVFLFDNNVSVVTFILLDSLEGKSWETVVACCANHLRTWSVYKCFFHFHSFNFIFLLLVKMCDKPAPPANGFVQIPCSTTYKGKCSFECRSGFFLNGSKTVSCTEDSTWFPIPGKCEGKERNRSEERLSWSQNKVKSNFS